MRKCRVAAAFLVVIVALLWAAPASADDGAGSLPFRLTLPGVARTEPPPVVRLVAVGDIMMGRSIGWTIENYGPASVFGGMLPFLAEADLTIGNLECAITERGTPEPKAYTFRAPPVAAGALAGGGFDVVALSNNHAMDYGVEGLEDTLATLGGASIAAVGAGANEAEAAAPVFLDRSGIRFAFLSFMDVPVEYGGFDTRSWEAGPASPGIAWLETERMVAAVAAAKANADIVVVLLHFGFEGDTHPSAAQQAQARAAIDAGATLVVGSHPHVLQPVEEYGGGLIAYSLGNFVFDYEESDAPTAVLAVDFSREGIVAWRMVPAYVDADGLPHLQ